MVINTAHEPTESMLFGRLLNISQGVPILKMKRGRGTCNGPSALEVTLGNNYIYVGSEHKNLSLDASPLAPNGQSPEQYRRWLWGRICAKDCAVLCELEKVTLNTQIAHWPEDYDIAVIVRKAVYWLWNQKPTPNIISDLDLSGQHSESSLGWDGYARKHEVLYNPYRTSSLFDDYDEAWDCFVNLPPAIHINVVRVLAYKKAQTMTITDWDSERRQSFLVDIANGRIEGGERSLFVLFPNHGWCVGADDAKDLLEGILSDFSGRRNFE